MSNALSILLLPAPRQPLLLPARIQPPKPVSWRLVYYNPNGRNSCGLCGHDIKREFHVMSSTGERRIVGSECINTLLSPDERPKVALFKRRVSRAERQWREKLPLARDGESREQYISRRVTEMANARRAFNASLNRTTEVTARRERMFAENKQRIQELWDQRRATGSREYDELLQSIYRDAENPILSEIEATYTANRFDFAHKAAWKVRAI